VYKITLNTCLKHSRGKAMRAQVEAALRCLDSQEESSPLSGEAEAAGGAREATDGTDVPDAPREAASAIPIPDQAVDALVEQALMAEISEKCHYFMTFLLTEEQRVALLLKDLFDQVSLEDLKEVLRRSHPHGRSRK
jgi:hypothetical protein